MDMSALAAARKREKAWPWTTGIRDNGLEGRNITKARAVFYRRLYSEDQERGGKRHSADGPTTNPAKV